MIITNTFANNLFKRCNHLFSKVFRKGSIGSGPFSFGIDFIPVFSCTFIYRLSHNEKIFSVVLRNKEGGTSLEKTQPQILARHRRIRWKRILHREKSPRIGVPGFAAAHGVRGKQGAFRAIKMKARVQQLGRT